MDNDSRIMLLTLALVIFAATIMVFFSQEFVKTAKRIFAVRGAKLVLPLAIASWLIYNFDFWVLWLFYYYREVLQTILSLMVKVLPFARFTAPILLLTLVSVVPVLLVDWIYRKRNYKSYPHPYLVSTLIWLVSAAILIML